MALASITKTSQTASVWVSGSHRTVKGSAKQALIIDDQQANASQDDGHQHEAAYKSLINVMLREHRSATTDLIIETGNDVIYKHLLSATRPGKAHLTRNWEIVVPSRRCSTVSASPTTHRRKPVQFRSRGRRPPAIPLL